MAQVSTQAQLLAALNALDPSIQVTAGFTISSQITIQYPVTIESLNATAPNTLTKDSSYFTYLFRVTEGGSLTLGHIILDGNSQAHPKDNANNRSLVYVTGGTLALHDGAVLQNNNSYLEGGGIYLNSSSSYTNTLSLSDNAKITGCYSRTNGGGVMIAASNANDAFFISKDVLIENNTAANGGGLYFRAYAEGVGGALTIKDRVQIINNTAGSTGGGICFSGYRNGGSSPSVLTLDGSLLVSGNQATHGAGVYFYAANGGDSLKIAPNASVTNNTASQNGGGVYMAGQGASADLSIDNASITANTAGTGGGLYLLTNSGGNIDITQGVITGNKASNGDSGTGGGLWIQNQSQENGLIITLSNTAISQNQATAHGGGMALYAGAGSLTFRDTGSTVSGNLCARDGGGLVVSGSGPGALDFQQTRITGNAANGSGGGIYYAITGNGVSSNITMSGANITGNTAGREGGGLRLMSGNGFLTTTLTDCAVTSNTAQSNSGGGIWNGGGSNNLTLNGTTSVSSNSSEAGNGGGIYFNSENGVLLLTDRVTITGNHADAVPSEFGNHGGGICLVPGALTVEGQTEISSNRAGKYGGAVSASENSVVTITSPSSSIHDNSSGEFGGAIWNSGNSVVTVASNAFSNNQAPYGGDIYNNASLYLEGAQSITNGVYIVNRSAVPRLSSALPEASVIQLEASNYVSPNPEGTPIVVGEATAAYPLLTQADADAFKKPASGFDGWEIRLSDDRTQVLLAPAAYRIQYENLMGASNPNPDSYTADTPDINLLPPGPVPGYRFIGWFDAPSGGNQITVIPRGSTGDIILYARWEAITGSHTITFCGNDDCCSPACCIPCPISGPSEASIVLPNTIPRRCGYCFLIWNTDCCGRGESYLPGETIASLTRDLHLYAIWRRNPHCCPCPPPVTGSFTALKRDSSTNAALNDATFTLSVNGAVVMTALSDSLGRLFFKGLKPGVYELTETVPPPGYQLNTAIHRVVVNLSGRVTIDGQPADNYVLFNTPSETGRFYFTKADASTGLPLAGATFTLSNGLTAVSDANGIVDFGYLPAGGYALRETVPPDGYAPVVTDFTVSVSETGAITVAGQPLSDFRPLNTQAKSAPPIVNTIVEGEVFITGSGIPGATVRVQYPDSTQGVVTVGSSGQWLVLVPSTVQLLAGQVVYANQTVPGLGASDNVSTIVQPQS